MCCNPITALSVDGGGAATGCFFMEMQENHRDFDNMKEFYIGDSVRY